MLVSVCLQKQYIGGKEYSRLVGIGCDQGRGQLLLAVCLPKQYVGGQEVSSWWEAGVTMDLVNCRLWQYACTWQYTGGKEYSDWWESGATKDVVNCC